MYKNDIITIKGIEKVTMKERNLIMKEISLNIKGMMCTGCENRVKNALENIEGIEKVSADHVSGNVNIVCDDTVYKKAIESAIEELGFEIVK